MVESERDFEVVGLGVSTVDLIHVVDELPGQELVQKAHQTLLQGGGPVATALVTLARLGSRTAMIDRLGDDWRGRLILDEFEREGVAVDRIEIEQGATSSISTVLVRKRDGARTFVFSPGSSRELGHDDIADDIFGKTKILHLNGRHMQACLEAAKTAQKSGVKVSFDGGAGRYRAELEALIPLTDICIVARQFAFQFSGVASIDRSARQLLGAGPELVVITAGVEGCWVFQKGQEPFHQPAFRIVDVVDTTGAGDAFHGAFLHGIVSGFDLRECARFASAVAAMNTRFLGGRAGIPSADEVTPFILQAETM